MSNFAYFQFVSSAPTTFFDYPNVSVKLTDDFERKVNPTSLDIRDKSLAELSKFFKSMDHLNNKPVYGKTNTVGENTMVHRYSDFISSDSEDPPSFVMPRIDAFEEEMPYLSVFRPYEFDFMTELVPHTTYSLPTDLNSFEDMGDYYIFNPKTRAYMGRQSVELYMHENAEVPNATFFGTVSTDSSILNELKNKQFEVVKDARGLLTIVKDVDTVVGSFCSQMFYELITMFPFAQRKGLKMWVKPLYFPNEHNIAHFSLKEHGNLIDFNKTIRFQNYEVFFGINEPRENNFVKVSDWFFPSLAETPVSKKSSKRN